jgi:hypothetical protein
LYAKIWIEGFYSPVSQGGPGLIMENATYGGAASAPFGGCLYHTGVTANPTDADYVILSAMDPLPPHNLIEAQTGILKTDGSINVAFTNAVSSTGSYYIRVQHRSSIETWSASAIVIGTTTALLPYDFTSSQSSAFGGNLADQGDGTWGLFSGDITDEGYGLGGIVPFQDGIIASGDYGDMETATYFTQLGYVIADITGDGIVESADYGLIENNVYYTRLVVRP